MNLPAHPQGGVQIGISDILQWRDCATRMEFGMRRHTEQGEAPESWSPANAYGSAIHLCLEMLDDGSDIDEAVQAAFAKFKQWLEPSDLKRLEEDMEKYQARDILGATTILNEGEISFRLFVHPVVGQVWFRARIDRLYQMVDHPNVFMHIDYKSSKWAKSHQEVHEDLQLWSYNLAIHEYLADEFPEFERPQLQQIYDQLMFGQVPTQKSIPQREQIRDWLVKAVTAVIEDEEALPTFNQWCPWCPLKMDCPVVQYQLTDWAVTKIAALMPREERRNKDGSLSKRQGKVELDPERLGDYVELLPDVKRGKQVLELFEKEVTGTLKQMPDSDLLALGKKKSERSIRTFTTEAKRQVVEELGLARALMLFDLSLASVERVLGETEEGEKIASLAESQRGYTVVADA